jgi:DNA-binding MarR family transcriptional regulator
LPLPTENREQVISALRDWEHVSMSTTMGAFLQFAKEQGMSAPQIGALIHIDHRGACGVTDIGDELGVTSAAASQMLERLVQGGLVERREDPDDRRAKRIVLTERGHRLVRGIGEIRQRQFAALADTMSPRERGLVAAALRTLVAHSGDVPARPTPLHVRPNAKEHPDR